MKLSNKTLLEIASYIKDTEIEYEGWDRGYEIEVEQDGIEILVYYDVFGELVVEYNYHSEVMYNCYEDMTHLEIKDAKVTDVVAFDEKGNEIEVENVNEIKYY